MTIQLLLEKNKNIHLGQHRAQDVLDHIPANVYQLSVLETPISVSYEFVYRGDTLPVPEARYGNHDAMVAVVTDGYDRVNPPIGAIAVGLKGSGKSVLCNDICNRMLKHGIPVLLIESNIGIERLRLIMSVTGPCVMYFDEFGKHYTETKQRNKLLALFSDASYRGYVFLVTANTKEELSDFIMDRPGRFAYRFEMNEVDSVALHDFFKKNRIPTERLPWVGSIRKALSFDALLAMVTPLRTATSFPDFQRRLNWLNVPKPFTQAITVRQARVAFPEGKKDFLENFSGVIEGNMMRFSFTRKGEQFTDQWPLLDANGFLAFPDSQTFVTKELSLNLDVSAYRCLDSMLAPGMPFYRNIENYGAVTALPTRVQDTSLTEVEGFQAVRPRSADDVRSFGYSEMFTIDLGRAIGLVAGDNAAAESIEGTAASEGDVEVFKEIIPPGIHNAGGDNSASAAPN